METAKKPLLIIPAYNEQENIAKVVDQLIQEFPQYEYVVVNDGSGDLTEEICEKNGYNLLNLPINLGIGGGSSGRVSLCEKVWL